MIPAGTVRVFLRGGPTPDALARVLVLRSRRCRVLEVPIRLKPREIPPELEAFWDEAEDTYRISGP